MNQEIKEPSIAPFIPPFTHKDEEKAGDDGIINEDRFYIVEGHGYEVLCRFSYPLRHPRFNVEKLGRFISVKHAYAFPADFQAIPIKERDELSLINYTVSPEQKPRNRRILQAG